MMSLLCLGFGVFTLAIPSFLCIQMKEDFALSCWKKTCHTVTKLW